MALTYTPEPALGTPCPDFSLPATSGDIVTRDRAAKTAHGPADAFLVMFICNHCPYVKAIEKRLVELHSMFKDRNVSMVAISANDAARYDEDSFEKMNQGLSVPLPLRRVPRCRDGFRRGLHSRFFSLR